MKVLFLDVDGVLNTMGEEYTCRGIHLDKVARVKEICKRTGCQVVVSSTWRKREASRQILVKVLKDQGIPILGYTPGLAYYDLDLGSTRSAEIQLYLDNNDWVKEYVILDDIFDLRDLKHRHVRTSPYEGLTAEKALEVIKKFK